MTKRRKPVVQSFAVAPSQPTNIHDLTAVGITVSRPRIERVAEHDIEAASLTVRPVLETPTVQELRSKPPDALIKDTIKDVCAEVINAGRKPPSTKELPDLVLPRLHAQGYTASRRHIMDLDVDDRPRLQRGEHWNAGN